MTSRISGFYKKPINERLNILSENSGLSESGRHHLKSGGGIDLKVADLMSENVISTHGLPMSIALNFRINQKDVLVPMSVEEPSIVAAASNAARLIRLSGGFQASSTKPVMTAQVQFDEVDCSLDLHSILESNRSSLIDYGNSLIPRMVNRGGGLEDIELRILDHEEGIIVFHVFVNVLDAMGANIVDTIAEGLAPKMQELVGGKIGLRILSNLPLRRMVEASAFVSDNALGGRDLATGIARASRFAELDIFRASTHNKGIMNGIDAVAVALGQDWRSIEAGAHAFAALTGSYKPLATWKLNEEGLVGKIQMPLAVGTVGGSTKTSKSVRAAFEIIGVENAGELAQVIAVAGLASNLAALRALAGEGIQKGHMNLHNRKAEALSQMKKNKESVNE